MLPIEKIKQIDADAITAGNGGYDWNVGYIAGATAEAEKAAGLVEALIYIEDKSRLNCYTTVDIAEICHVAAEALNNYKKLNV